ncbi:MAG: ABC transporter ATP-binding protein/permease [Atopobiaceae bacterium]|jgi:ATP-binding cassette subfamily B protein|nr:ABC transporter ATP-binding protein/permease [Atopobiaceae bacterium]MCH4120281.1 ABC transporter ATP-binding protein/permease [Atopobiaceae bacterium]MCI1317814.1 ABC transporter ATP-binding protein/permease [Atopobiaceae bacterium]MCI1388933.1 ABC transporter ATP-binding protein/permease [Atopobiaceae bacterium]MCI1431833.1 ABC transporter ATP-binding protein/permease [Atopobiaceae bacterium]
MSDRDTREADVREADATAKAELAAEQEDEEQVEASSHIGAYSRKQAFALLKRLLAPYWPRVLATLGLMVCDIVGMLYVPTELSAMLNSAISGAGMDVVWRHGIAMLIAALVGSGGCIASYWVASRLAADIGRDMRIAVFARSLDMSTSEFATFGTASMITRTLSDVNVVQQAVLMTVTMVAPVPIVCVVSITLSASIDVVMGQLLAAVVVVMLAISVVAVVRSAPTFMMLQGFIDRMNVRLRESVTGARVIRAFGREDFERHRLNRTFDDYAKNAIRVNLVFAVTDSLTFFLMNIVEVLVMWVGADRVGAHAMQIGSISALVQYAIIILFFMMMAQFALIGMPRAAACLARAAQVLDVEPSIRDAARTLPAQEGCEEVARFCHASLRFEDASEDTLHDVDFPIMRGEMTAIIGNTGSGKSTIASMLLRLHDTTAGEVRVLGHDVRGMGLADLRAHISYVPQRAWLFSGTIAENLRHGREDATDEELWHALDVAQASFVRELPEGLEAPVAQGGSNFSGGQRQRLAIARALVRKADLYVFDDSFSALDYRTDAALRHALANELKDSAVLLIAQRVSTIRDAGRIVVLNEGRIVGQGTHDELMGTCDAYREIVLSQERGGGASDVR